MKLIPDLIKKRYIYLPTLRGSIVLGLILVITGYIFINNIHLQLAKSHPCNGEILIVEGWLPDYALSQAVEYYLEGSYKRVVTTGGPLDNGSYLIQFKTYAHIAKYSLDSLGIVDSMTVAVPSETVRKDRTYQSAVTFQRWLSNSELDVRKVDVVSLGAHTYRTSLVYQKVLGTGIKVGRRSIENEDYDPKYWWKSSEGVKTVITEIISVIYTHLFLAIR